MLKNSFSVKEMKCEQYEDYTITNVIFGSFNSNYKLGSSSHSTGSKIMILIERMPWPV